MPSLLLGSADAGANFVLRGGDEVGMQALAKKKFEKFSQYLTLYPEFKIVFIGDNGQADYAAAQMIYQSFPHAVEHVFIHEVAPRANTFGWSEFDQLRLPGAPVHFFEDYISAAVAAATRPNPLLTLEGLKSVIAAADLDFERIKWQNEATRLAMRQQIDQSKACAWEAIKARELHMPQPAASDAEVSTPKTTPVKGSTPRPSPPQSPQGIKPVHELSQPQKSSSSTNVFSRHLQAVGDLLRASEPKEPVSPKPLHARKEPTSPKASHLQATPQKLSLSPVTGPDDDPDIIVPGELDLTKLEDVAQSAAQTMEAIHFQLTGDRDSSTSGPDADAAGGTTRH